MNKKNKKSNWTPTKNYKHYFDASSDTEFKQKHPAGYIFLVILGLTAFLLPANLFVLLADVDNGWSILGYVGGLIFGIGLFNFVAIIIKQYLGHWVSIISLSFGGIIMLISYLLGQ